MTLSVLERMQSSHQIGRQATTIILPEASINDSLQTWYFSDNIGIVSNVFGDILVPDPKPKAPAYFAPLLVPSHNQHHEYC